MHEWKMRKARTVFSEHLGFICSRTSRSVPSPALGWRWGVQMEAPPDGSRVAHRTHVLHLEHRNQHMAIAFLSLPTRAKVYLGNSGGDFFSLSTEFKFTHSKTTTVKLVNTIMLCWNETQFSYSACPEINFLVMNRIHLRKR